MSPVQIDIGQGHRNSQSDINPHQSDNNAIFVKMYLPLGYIKSLPKGRYILTKIALLSDWCGFISDCEFL